MHSYGLKEQGRMDLDKDSGNQVWVMKWLDYSQRFGFGYVLSNYVTGVSFSDNSKIVLDPTHRYTHCYEPNSFVHQEVEIDAGRRQALPPFLSKRMTLLHHFESYLRKCKASLGLDCPEPTLDLENIENLEISKEPLIHLVSWMKSKKGVAFYLSDGTVQVNFVDHSKVVVTPLPDHQNPQESTSIRVIYVTHHGTKQLFTIDATTVLPSSIIVKQRKEGEEGPCVISVKTKEGGENKEACDSQQPLLSQEVTKRLLFLLQCIPKLLKLTMK
eukprot:TRINITY_DN3203_c0_g1_i1.p1 TRINITY_DN3203_c0_g1~~TRINITY_DN3203_c0_g1_i1.p1  ORF type:complete len:272 (-),score=50.94 TRINITY_DN3203_c0_g1_i1:78-893(-)